MSFRTPEPGPGPSKAMYTCIPCKKLKRKCDKIMPACSLCSRTGRQCDYPEVAQTPSVEHDLAALRERLSELEGLLVDRRHPPSRQSTIQSYAASSAAWQVTRESPTLAFLDIDCFQFTGMQLPTPHVEVPMDVLAVLSHDNALAEIFTSYFTTIHTWFPFISKKRLDMGNQFQNAGPDTAMLFLAMKLVTSKPSDPKNGDSSLHSVAKSFLAILEANGYVSLMCLQAMVLIALFEHGHAIYPAAWMTVGSCARYADLLGLCDGRDASSVLPRVRNWLEIEERRRACWAIFVLDRSISLGSRRRFAAAEPADSSVLPVDDAAWDAGNATRAMGMPTSTSYDVPQTPFARMCQAALLVSRAAAAHRVAPSRPAQTKLLANEMLEFSAIQCAELAQSHHLALIPSRCLSLSALFLLLDRFTCPEKMKEESGYAIAGEAKHSGEMDVQAVADGIIKQISQDAHGIANSILRYLDPDASFAGEQVLDRISPFAFDMLYCALASFHWYRREGGINTLTRQVTDFNACLQQLAKRWALATEYLRAGEHHDPECGII